MNIQQQTALEVSETERVMANNEELDTPSSQDISNLFAGGDVLYRSSSDSAEYKHA